MPRRRRTEARPAPGRLAVLRRRFLATQFPTARELVDPAGRTKHPAKPIEDAADPARWWPSLYRAAAETGVLRHQVRWSADRGGRPLDNGMAFRWRRPAGRLRDAV